MRLLYLTQGLELPEDTGSDRHFFFCRYAANVHGWDVDAITSNVDYKKAIPRYPGRWFLLRKYEGVQVRYVYTYASIRGSVAKRAWYYLTYFITAFLQAIRLPRPDVIYAVSTPLTVGYLGYVLSRIWRRPFVFEVTDLWPDVFVAMGVMRDGVVLRVLRWMEGICYRNAMHVVALTSGIRDGIVAKGVAESKVTTIPNGFDSSLFTEVGPDARRGIREELGLAEGDLCCMYLGAHGIYNALGTIIDAATELADCADIVFVLLGDGDDKSRLRTLVSNRNLKSVRFLDPIPRLESVAFLSAADLFLLPNRAGDFYRMNLPNKLFDFLASARPVVVAGEGETANVVRAAEAGLVVPAEDAAGMAATIRELRDAGGSSRADMGRRGRAYVAAHFDRRAGGAAFIEVLRQGQQERSQESGTS